MEWETFKEKENQVFYYGIENNLIYPYSDDFIKKLRSINILGVPASIMLLTNKFTNGHCYDATYLLSKALIDEVDDFFIIVATINSLKLNPKYKNYNHEHCFIEVINDNKHYIYDASSGWIYDKDLFWQIEEPTIIKKSSKEDVLKFIKLDNIHEKSKKENKYDIVDIIKEVEDSYTDNECLYSLIGDNVLKREVDLFKKQINYDSLLKQMENDDTYFKHVESFIKKYIKKV